MAIHQLFHTVLTKALSVLLVSFVLTACSTEENFDNPANPGTGQATGTTPELPIDPLPVPAPTVNISVSAPAIVIGQTATLSWSASDATECSVSGAWSGSRNTSGSETVSPTNNSTYSMTCTGDGGSASDSVELVVNIPPPPPAVNLSVSPSTIDEGQSTRLSWTSSNASSCTASGAWRGGRSTSGAITVSPTSTTGYTLTCSGAGGSASDSVTVTVNPVVPAPAVNLSVSPSTIDEGQSTRLSWTSSNASSCTASGAWRGGRSTSGAITVSPTSTTGYTLTCSGAGGSASDSVTVTVNPIGTAGDINLSWVAPVEREDGTPIMMSEIGGYRIYYGTTPGSYPDHVDVTDGSTMTATLIGLASGTYYIVVTTYDVNGRESAHSSMVSATF